MGYSSQDIQTISLFKGLDPQERLSLFEVSRRLHLDPDTIVVQEGKEGASLFVILNGSVRVSKGIRGELEHLATLTNGDFFGEMALLEKAPRSATVTTTESSIILEFKQETLEELFERFPRIGTKVYQNLAGGLSRRLRQLAERIKEISWRD
ncbi:MAG: cyclic nucleotide-binding domain-containing protein [Deltaproteobacteria bacterium]|nr:cyclic nucleotide-binding domain-containing protein [Deltaproteobacteria bacterium]